MPGTLPHPVADLIKELFALRRRGGLSDAEARWVLALVLPSYGLTVNDLARVLTPTPFP